jgi:hypothetical protein
MFISNNYYLNGIWYTWKPERFLVNYWTVLFTLSYQKNETWQVSYFRNNDSVLGNNDPTMRLWKLIHIFYLFNNILKILHPFWTSGLGQNYSIFKGKLQKQKRSGIITNMATTHGTVKWLAEKVKGHGHNLHMDNFFPSPDLFNDLTWKKISCGTGEHNRKGIPHDLSPPNNQNKIIFILGQQTAWMQWSGRINGAYILTNMHNPLTSGNNCDKQGNAMKPRITHDCSQHMG